MCTDVSARLHRPQGRLMILDNAETGSERKERRRTPTVRLAQRRLVMGRARASAGPTIRALLATDR